MRVQSATIHIQCPAVVDDASTGGLYLFLNWDVLRRNGAANRWSARLANTSVHGQYAASAFGTLSLPAGLGAHRSCHRVDANGFVLRLSEAPDRLFGNGFDRASRADQRRVASTPSSASCAAKPAFSSRFATSRGTSRPLVSLFGVPV